MMVGQIDGLTGVSFAVAKARAYWELLKFRLSFLVAFSCAFGFVLASAVSGLVYTDRCCLSEDFCFPAASGIINQIIEKDLDRMMTRTMSRPLPTQRVSVGEAIVICLFCFVARGFDSDCLYKSVNDRLIHLSLVLYAFAYTPLKRVGPIAVFRGSYSRSTSTTFGLDGGNWRDLLSSLDHFWHSIYLAVSSFLGHCLGC